MKVRHEVMNGGCPTTKKREKTHSLTHSLTVSLARLTSKRRLSCTLIHSLLTPSLLIAHYVPTHPTPHSLTPSLQLARAGVCYDRSVPGRAPSLTHTLTHSLTHTHTHTLPLCRCRSRSRSWPSTSQPPHPTPTPLTHTLTHTLALPAPETPVSGTRAPRRVAADTVTATVTVTVTATVGTPHS